MGVLKLIGKIIIFLITLAVFLALIVIFLVKFKNETILSDFLKREIIKNPYLVSLINLNQPGDARFIYLSSKDSIIPMELRYLDNSQIDEEIEVWIQEMIIETLNKDVSIDSLLLDVSKQEVYSDKDLNQIRDGFASRFESKPKLFIVYLTKYQEKESYVGITLHRDTIYIFRDAMENLTEQKQTLKQLERSTIMHEWGHLLGVEHVDNPDCIMSSFVEVEGRALYRGKDIPTRYCPETTQKLDIQRKRFLK